MSDIRIILPGSETVTLTGQTVDKLIRAGDGDAALLYLYILKTQGQKTSSEAAIALDKSKGWVSSAMAVLSRIGLVQLDTGTGGSAGAAYNDGTGIKESNLSKEPRQYTEQEVIKEILSGSDFSIVIEETQRRFGRKLTSDDMIRLFGIYDDLRLPPEVILLLITHCITESRKTGNGRLPGVRYIEKAAYDWEREGIYSLEKAEEYLKALEERKSIRGEIKKILQTGDREFSSTQKEYIDRWLDMGFKPDVIAVAYDKTMINTGKMAWRYMDTILANWHSKGLRTVQDVKEKDSSLRNRSADGYKSSETQKHGEPNLSEMERAQRILNKIKEE